MQKNKYWKFFLGAIVIIFVIIILNAEFITKHFNFLMSAENIQTFLGLGILILFIIFNYIYQKNTIRMRAIVRKRHNI